MYSVSTAPESGTSRQSEPAFWQKTTLWDLGKSQRHRLIEVTAQLGRFYSNKAKSFHLISWNW